MGSKVGESGGRIKVIVCFVQIVRVVVAYLLIIGGASAHAQA